MKLDELEKHEEDCPEKNKGTVESSSETKLSVSSSSAESSGSEESGETETEGEKIDKGNDLTIA